MKLLQSDFLKAALPVFLIVFFIFGFLTAVYRWPALTSTRNQTNEAGLNMSEEKNTFTVDEVKMILGLQPFTLTKRELFAAMAMQAYLSSSRSKASRAEEFAAVAVLLADALIEELEKPRE